MIDAFVQLAMMSKASRVFAADEGKFLAFPLLTPLTYPPAMFATLMTPSTAAEYAAAGEFSRTVNFLPRDIVASLESDRFLWDVYIDVMTRADVAVGSGADTGSTDGSSVLYQTATDGTRTESPEYAAYRQYRDAWIVAREDYGARKLSGELTSDPAEKQHWTDTVEPTLRAVLTQAESDWSVLGHREKVEAALQAEAAAAARNPAKRWSDWSSAINPDVDIQSDPGGAYAPTGIAPWNFATEGEWLPFELSSGEMTTLVAEAPPELKVVLDQNGGASNVERISFEYRSVSVVRPWFRADALTSRIWRSADPDLMLSNGEDSPAGACPAYVTAIVFMRNLKVTPRAATPAAPVLSDMRFTIRPELLTRRHLQAVRPAGHHAPPATQSPGAVRAQAFRRISLQSFAVAPTLASRHAPRTAAAGVAPALEGARFDHRLMLRVANPAVAVRADTPIGRRRFRDVARLGTAPPVAAEPAVATPAPAPDPPASADISVLAFICKRLPKTPNALPDLTWP